jgi:hypothetical protein
MEYANLTFGWPRGGGSHMVLPAGFPPPVGADAPVTKARSTQWSYIMNVCTHSYSLWPYSWAEWEQFIDWQALWWPGLLTLIQGGQGGA